MAVRLVRWCEAAVGEVGRRVGLAEELMVGIVDLVSLVDGGVAEVGDTLGCVGVGGLRGCRSRARLCNLVLLRLLLSGSVARDRSLSRLWLLLGCPAALVRAALRRICRVVPAVVRPGISFLSLRLRRTNGLRDFSRSLARGASLRISRSGPLALATPRGSLRLGFLLENDVLLQVALGVGLLLCTLARGISGNARDPFCVRCCTAAEKFVELERGRISLRTILTWQCIGRCGLRMLLTLKASTTCSTLAGTLASCTILDSGWSSSRASPR